MKYTFVLLCDKTSAVCLRGREHFLLILCTPKIWMVLSRLLESKSSFASQMNGLFWIQITLTHEEHPFCSVPLSIF